MVGNQNAFAAVKVDGSVVTYHCARKHPVDGAATEKDEGADRPGRRTVEAGGAASRKEAAKTAAPGRRQKALSGDKGTQKTKKASVAPKEK